MAIFERNIVNKVLIDDTEPINCTIENWKNVDGHTVIYTAFQNNLIGTIIIRNSCLVGIHNKSV